MKTNSSRGTPGILDFCCDVERLPNGNTLIVDAGDETSQGSEIIEVDSVGNLVWQYGEGLNFAHAARRLADGTTVICDTTNNRIVQVTPEGNIVFTSESWDNGTGRLSDGSHLDYPNDVHCLEDGGFLITDRDNDRFVVVSRGGQVVRQFCDLDGPHNCDMLPNGNVLCADSNHNRVIEVDPNDNIVWYYGDGSEDMLNWPRDADRLPDGTTLITDSRNNRILRVSAEGKVVWAYQADYTAMPYEADALANGNVLISEQFHHQVLEVDPSGTIVWQFRNRRIAHPIHTRLSNGSFRNVGPDGLPEDWMLYTRLCSDPNGGKVVWDTDRRGRRYPGVEYDRNGALCLFQVVQVVPGQAYTLAGRIKTDLEEGGIAYFQLAFLDAYGGLVENVETAPKGELFVGSNDWTQDQVIAVAPPEARAVEVRLFITGKGMAWMRGLLLYC